MTGSAERVEVSVVHELWCAGEVILDVRTPEEYATGHLPGALNRPVDRLAFAAAELPSGQLITVCSLGHRSWRAAQLLAGSGREVLSLTGGVKAWTAAGLPVSTGPRPGERRPRRRWRFRSLGGAR